MSASSFEIALGAAARAGAEAGREAAGSGKYTRGQLADLNPSDVGYEPVDILLKVTGNKTLGDTEEEALIVGCFEDNFFEAIEEYEED